MLFLGAAMGVAGILFVHTRSAQTSHAILTEFINPFREIFRLATIPDPWDLETLEGLASIQVELSLQAQMIAYNNTFFTVAAMCFIAAPFVYLFNRSVNADIGKTADPAVT